VNTTNGLPLAYTVNGDYNTLITDAQSKKQFEESIAQQTANQIGTLREDIYVENAVPGSIVFTFLLLNPSGLPTLTGRVLNQTFVLIYPAGHLLHVNPNSLVNLNNINSSSNNASIIIGSVVGGAMFIIILSILVILLIRRRRRPHKMTISVGSPSSAGTVRTDEFDQVANTLLALGFTGPTGPREKRSTAWTHSPEFWDTNNDYEDELPTSPSFAFSSEKVATPKPSFGWTLNSDGSATPAAVAEKLQTARQALQLDEPLHMESNTSPASVAPAPVASPSLIEPIKPVEPIEPVIAADPMQHLLGAQ